VQFPEVVIKAHLAVGLPAGDVVHWSAPSSFTAVVRYKGFSMTIPCTPDPGQGPIGSTSVEPPPATPTTAWTAIASIVWLLLVWLFSLLR
jgi:hypothetical protein